LRRLPRINDVNVLVGAATADDAGVYRLSKKLALVQTVDFFTPIVDDPFTYGQIAATNSLSDVYAMGGRPVTALNVMGIPEDLVPPDDIHQIIRGGAAKAREAGCVLLGGHTIRNPEPIFGLSVTGFVSPDRMITNARAEPGDCLVLTKPLGTGIVTTGIKRGIVRDSLAKQAIRVMTRLNTVGADLAEAGLVKAGTDITGFGFLGHLASLCLASKVSATISITNIPPISPAVLELINQNCVPGGTRQNLEAVNPIIEWGDTPDSMRLLLADAQTSGGLLLCVNPKKLRRVMRILEEHRSLASALVGQITGRARTRLKVAE
jgi:selenide, water dikinase